MSFVNFVVTTFFCKFNIYVQQDCLLFNSKSASHSTLCSITSASMYNQELHRISFQSAVHYSALIRKNSARRQDKRFHRTGAGNRTLSQQQKFNFHHFQLSKKNHFSAQHDEKEINLIFHNFTLFLVFPPLLHPP